MYRLSISITRQNAKTPSPLHEKVIKISYKKKMKKTARKKMRDCEPFKKPPLRSLICTCMTYQPSIKNVQGQHRKIASHYLAANEYLQISTETSKNIWMNVLAKDRWKRKNRERYKFKLSSSANADNHLTLELSGIRFV